ncbi:hypothetical protein GCM10027586_07980 [Kineococcus gypseus]
MPAAWALEGPVITSVGYSELGGAAGISGELGHDGSCLTVGPYPAVWPQGTTWDEQSASLTLPDGTRAAPGALIDGGGTYQRTSALRYDGEERIATVLTDCAGATGEVAVFTPGSTVTAQAPPA